MRTYERRMIVIGRYNSIKTVYKGLKFDSKTEESFYKLKEIELANGEIFNLRTQVSYLLQEGFKDREGKKIQDVCYLADIVYEDKEGNTHVVDVKPCEALIESLFKLKWKMLKFIHRDFIYHIIIKDKTKTWVDLENKEEKKLMKERIKLIPKKVNKKKIIKNKQTKGVV